MKKLLIALMIMIGCEELHATEYTYLTFELTDGSKVSVNASSLTFTISGTTLTAGSQTFTLTNLSKMYFSQTDETTSTGVSSLESDPLNNATDIYNISGTKISKSQMGKGIYIIKNKTNTYKLIVK